MPPRSPLSPLLAACLGLALWAGAVAAEEVSLKVENYLFAASEALDDGEPALALSLLRRAQAEDPGCCIVDEYLCRAYLALDNLDLAREAYGSFVGCMQLSDEAVLGELDQLLQQAEQRQAEGGAAISAPPAPVPAPQIASPVAAPTPRPPGSAGRAIGWTLLGTGAAATAAGSVGMGLSWTWGEHYVEEGQRGEYEALLPWNHAAVIGAGVGAGVLVTGLLVELAAQRRGRQVALVPSFEPSTAAVGLSVRGGRRP